MNDIYNGAVFHKWTVIDDTHVPTPSHYSYKVLCRCACGTERLVEVRSLRSGHSKSCGCRKQDNAKEKIETLKGKKFGRLTIVDRGDAKHHYKLICECECGNRIYVGLHELEAGRISSCGCARSEDKKRKLAEMIGKTYGELTVEEIADYEASKVKCRCSCGAVVYPYFYDILKGATTSCGHIKSKGEEKIAKFLKEHEINFKREVSFQDCKDKNSLPFDFGIYSKDNRLIGLIEYNGDIHYSSRGTGWDTPERLILTQRHDYIKQKYCEKHGIPLLIVPFTFYDTLEDFITTSDFWQIVKDSFND